MCVCQPWHIHQIHISVSFSLFFCASLFEIQVDGRFLDIEGAKPLQTFVDFCNEGDFHFLVLGPKTSVVGGDAPLGSFSAVCVQRITLNTIVSQLPANVTPK